MQNSMGIFIFLGFDSKYLFLGIFGAKIQICLFMEKFATYTNPNMQNSMVMLFASVLGWK